MPVFFHHSASAQIFFTSLKHQRYSFYFFQRYFIDAWQTTNFSPFRNKSSCRFQKLDLPVCTRIIYTCVYCRRCKYVCAYFYASATRPCRNVGDRVCASRPRQGGVLSHPTWRFQFHFLSRRSPLAPAPLTPHLRPPCCTDLGPGVVSHPTPYYSLHVARGCKDRDPLLLSRSAPSILRLLLHSKLKVEFTNASSMCNRYGRIMFQDVRCFNFTGILSLTFVFNYDQKFTWK